MPKDTVKDVAVRKDGTLHPAGAEVEMAEDVVADLVAQGRLEPAKKAGKSGGKTDGQQDAGGSTQDQG